MPLNRQYAPMHDRLISRRANSKGVTCLARAATVPGFIAALLITGCASFKSGNVEHAPFRQLAVCCEDPAFRVEVAVPSPEEAAKLFDRKLQRKGISPNIS